MTVRTSIPDDLHVILSPLTSTRTRFRTLKEWGFPIAYGHFRQEWLSGIETVQTIEVPRWVWCTLMYFDRSTRKKAVAFGRAISSTRALKQIGRDLSAHDTLDSAWRLGGMRGVYGVLRGTFNETLAGQRVRRSSRLADQAKDTAI